VIECPLLPTSRKPPGSMASPLLQCQNSAIINKLPECDRAPSAQVLPQPMCSGDQDAPQPKASGDQDILQHRKATVEVETRFVEAIVFTKTPWPILSNNKYSMVDESWNLAIAAQDHQLALAGAPVGTPSACQLPSSPSIKIDPQTLGAVCLGFWLMLLYQISNIDYTTKCT